MTIEIEQSILGLALINNQAVAALGLKPSHFSDPFHADLFDEIHESFTLGKVVSPVTLKDRYDAAYLVTLIKFAASAVEAERTAEALKAESTKRRLRQAAEKILQTDDNLESIKILTDALDDASRDSLGSSLKTAREVSFNIIENLANDAPVYPTGLPRLDFAMSGGLQEGRLYSIASDSGHGKTLLASTISNNLKNSGVPHLFICAEMGENETHQRSIAKDLGIDSRAFYDKNHRSETFWSDIGYSAEREKDCLVYYDEPFLTFDRLKQIVSTAVVKYRIKGFILDYWQLVGGGERERADFLGRVAQWEAAACKRWKLWSINTAQLNRDGEVLGSGGLKRASDQMYHLIRPQETEPLAYLQMTKTRYTKFMHVGSETSPSLKINEKGGYFEQILSPY